MAQNPTGTSIRTFTLVLICFLGLNSTLYAQSASKGSLKDIAFLDGRWRGEFNGGPIDGGWTAPAGDNIVGYLRMMKEEKVTLYEIFAFEQTEKGPVAHVKHFKPGLISLEEKEVSDTYNFIEAGKNTALFEKDDASVRIIYELRSKNQLVIQRGKSENGKWVFVDLFVFKKIP
ncbi:hypothetical protein DYBT9275_05143 [Dyadobacter sp. CECT 9275]|uniref:DUF6265 domain-containing protein n=1 Tax=Dyadobacter helix TaxID=2822344 RepID=A0A916JJT7_9BACT|nr:DUF6265 family protein [Dyadobacter sp. CECT 9275]CAG5012275.1 hypothetical protein DYBT9275_05143 [Dyadobacter sp. CECT 9275]